MITQQPSSKLKPLINAILTLSSQEQFQVVMVLLQNLLGQQPIRTEAVKEVVAPRPKSVDDVTANFWPDDETVDDFLVFIHQQRQENLVK